jgi:predicted nucleic-acid-binding protein
MKGWILIENDKPIITSNNSIEVFKSKKDLLDYYGEALGDLNSIKKVILFDVDGEQ